MLLSEITFGSFLSYTPHPKTPEGIDAQEWMRRLKGDKRIGAAANPTSDIIAARLHARIHEMPFRDLFVGDVVLVPMPRSGLMKPGTLWVPLRLARAMVKQGLGSSVEEMLVRVSGVPKAATADPKNRPTIANHYASLRVDPRLEAPESILIIDDVVTTGSSLLAAANRLRESFPKSTIHGFVAMRTQSDPSDFARLLDPVMGTIELRGTRTHREP
jgi:hypothetical protein